MGLRSNKYVCLSVFWRNFLIFGRVIVFLALLSLVAIKYSHIIHFTVTIVRDNWWVDEQYYPVYQSASVPNMVLCWILWSTISFILIAAPIYMVRQLCILHSEEELYCDNITHVFGMIWETFKL